MFFTYCMHCNNTNNILIPKLSFEFLKDDDEDVRPPETKAAAGEKPVGTKMPAAASKKPASAAKKQAASPKKPSASAKKPAAIAKKPASTKNSKKGKLPAPARAAAAVQKAKEAKAIGSHQKLQARR